jgi:hypothetical protein
VTARGVIPPAEEKRLRAAAAAATAAADAFKEAVHDAWRVGGSVREIAVVAGKSPRTIQNWVEGVPRDSDA